MPTEKKQLQYKKKEGSCSWEYWNYFVTFHKIELGKGGMPSDRYSYQSIACLAYLSMDLRFTFHYLPIV